MKKQYKILCLTDHRHHSAENSIYELLKTMSAHPGAKYVDVATRGDSRNDDFFFGLQTDQLYVSRVEATFSYAKAFDTWSLAHKRPLSHYDIILLRLPRPIPDGFFDFLTAHFPENAIINRPSAIKETGSKAFLQSVRELCPPIHLCRNLRDIEAIRNSFPIVLKPFEGYGGRGILKISGNEVWEGDKKFTYQAFRDAYLDDPTPYLAMKYLEYVDQGDKRVLVAGRSVIGASLRKPAEGSWMCNVSQGGTSHYAELEPEEWHIAHQLIQILNPRGIVLFGFDTLMDQDGKRKLSEINTLSVGGLVQAGELSGEPVVQRVVDAFWEYIHSCSR